MATLVTGGTGFVGSNIVRALAKRGHDVVCLDLHAPDELVRTYVEPWADRVSFIQGDIRNVGDPESAAASHDITKIVHAAVSTGGGPNFEIENSRSLLDINLMGTANLLDLARTLSLERFLYVSSAAVYGEEHSPEDALREDAVLYPRKIYDATKYASELLTRRYGELHGFQTVSLRVTSTYGPMERVTGHRAVMSAIYRWIGNVVRGEPVRVGDRRQGRDYTYVVDTAEATCVALDAPSLSYDLYNVAVGRWTTQAEIINVLQELRPSLQVVDEPANEPGAVQTPVLGRLMDVTRLTEDIGFIPSFDLTAGIEDYIRWREESSFLD